MFSEQASICKVWTYFLRHSNSETGFFRIFGGIVVFTPFLRAEIVMWFTLEVKTFVLLEVQKGQNTLGLVVLSRYKPTTAVKQGFYIYFIKPVAPEFCLI